MVEYELRTYDIKIINKTSNYILIGNDNEKIAVNLLLDEMRIEELELKIMKKDIEIARLKKGYKVKGVGQEKEFVTIFNKNTK